LEAGLTQAGKAEQHHRRAGLILPIREIREAGKKQGARPTTRKKPALNLLLSLFCGSACG